jgi:hypothetical protein
MITFFTPEAVVLAASASFLTGFLWYSRFLFFKTWMKGEGISEDTLPKRTVYETLIISSYVFIAHCAIASVLAIMFELLAITSLAIALVLALLFVFGFIVTSRFIDMVYTPQEKYYGVQSQIKFLLGSGYYLGSIAVMTVVIFAMSSL